MKNLIVAFFLLLYFPLTSQSIIRHNYNSQIKFNDPLIHNICNIEYIYKSNYILAGKVKSLLCKTTDLKFKRVNYSRKHYYNKNKKVERIIEFGENINHIELDKKYYRYGGRYSVLVVKEGFSKSGRVQFYSELDKSKKLIIVKEMIDDQLKTLDSIYYVKNYEPILIKKYSADNDLIEVREIKYDEDKIVLSLRVRSTDYPTGAGLVYDKKDRINSLIPIKSANLDPFIFKLGDTIKLFDWTSTGFTYFNSSDTIIYDSKLSRVLIKKKKGGGSTIQLSKDLKPLKKNITFSNSKTYSYTYQYDYNENGDVILITRTKKGYEKFPQQTTYKYEYDKHKNWIYKKEFVDNELLMTIERDIEYYD